MNAHIVASYTVLTIDPFSQNAYATEVLPIASIFVISHLSRQEIYQQPLIVIFIFRIKRGKRVLVSDLYILIHRTGGVENQYGVGGFLCNRRHGRTGDVGFKAEGISTILILCNRLACFNAGLVCAKLCISKFIYPAYSRHNRGQRRNICVIDTFKRDRSLRIFL